MRRRGGRQVAHVEVRFAQIPQGVGGLAPELFGHWLELFEAAALELFVPSIAQEFAVRARRIAESLRLALFFRPSQPWTDDLRDRPPLDALAFASPWGKCMGGKTPGLRPREPRSGSRPWGALPHKRELTGGPQSLSS